MAFDVLHVYYDLPQGFPVIYQTWDLPTGNLSKYRLTRRGELIGPRDGLCDISTYLEAVATSVVASSGDGYYTEGERVGRWWKVYAFFERGRVVAIRTITRSMSTAQISGPHPEVA